MKMETLGGIEPIRDPIEHEVGMDEFSFGVAGDRLFTQGASTCTVIVSKNQNTQEITLGHFSAPTGDSSHSLASTQKVEEYFKELAQTDDTKDLKLFIFGATPFIENNVDTVEPDRAYFTQQIIDFAQKEKLANDSVKFNWSSAGVVVDVAIENNLITADYFSSDGRPSYIKTVEHRV